jgi:hypothetical protein
VPVGEDVVGVEPLVVRYVAATPDPVPSLGVRVTVWFVFFQAFPIDAVLSVVVGAAESGLTVNVAVDVFPTLSYAVTVFVELENVAPAVHE